ncbi:amidase signature enzyme [Eremomyces bilateralis CBS 781.70]|uniref:Amidase signature enzyme n=1 Tax=Eremomyces bilateralis CBS 781.70 TaxID=1392243 RepID=A0A6G1GBT0_9PEZI|nr:amidase signature enzyme [Eremomyces bilateralis CBS 781.70]KAF1815474.1 amidase signature enzyme [Eremomyces bilateralis CBS 781.70]
MTNRASPLPNWAQKSAQKRDSLKAKINPAWLLDLSPTVDLSESSTVSAMDVLQQYGRQVLSKQEWELTEEHDATGMLQLLAERKVSAVEVTTAFCKRAAIANQLVNCLTEVMFDEAVERAKELDEHFERTGKPLGRLHGLPISLKDSFNVKGVQSAIGYVSFLDHEPPTSNAALVDILLAEGAVVYCKTNVPVTLMMADSVNNVTGRTLNPNKLSLTAGGSTGGEGALVKLRGSLLGAGTDIAGSARIPALCNGIYGFRPTTLRVPFVGLTAPGRVGSPSPILPVIGPEGHSVRDLELFMRTVADSEPWKVDHTCVTVPWRTVAPPTRPLRFGYLKEDPSRPLHPTALRGMTSAARKLEDTGHAIVELDGRVPSLWETSRLAWKFFETDPQHVPAQHLRASGEPLVPALETTTLPELQGWEPSVDELFEMNLQRQALVGAWHDIVVAERLDAIILPTYQSTAVRHDTYGFMIYTVLANMLDVRSS